MAPREDKPTPPSVFSGVSFRSTSRINDTSMDWGGGDASEMVFGEMREGDKASPTFTVSHRPAGLNGAPHFNAEALDGMARECRKRAKYLREQAEADLADGAT